MLANCSGSLFLINTVIHDPDDVTLTKGYLVSLIFESLVIFAGSLYTLYFAFLVITIKVWHENLRMVMLPFVLGTLFGNFGRLLIMKEEFFVYRDGVCTPSLHLGSFCTIFANCLTIHTIPTVLIERIFAYVYLNDYESKKRRKIPFYTITIVLFYTLFLSISLYTTNLSVCFGAVYAAIVITTSSCGYIYLWYLNDKSYRKLGTSLTPRGYSLSGRFQLIENLRIFWLARNMFLVLIGEALLVISIRIMTALTDSNSNIYLQPVITIMQLIVITTCVLSCEKWRNHLILQLNLNDFIRRISRRKKIHTPQEIYFIQLDMAWN